MGIRYLFKMSVSYTNTGHVISIIERMFVEIFRQDRMWMNRAVSIKRGRNMRRQDGRSHFFFSLSILRRQILFSNSRVYHEYKKAFRIKKDINLTHAGKKNAAPWKAA